MDTNTPSYAAAGRTWHPSCWVAHFPRQVAWCAWNFARELAGRPLVPQAGHVAVGCDRVGAGAGPPQEAMSTSPWSTFPPDAARRCTAASDCGRNALAAALNMAGKWHAPSNLPSPR